MDNVGRVKELESTQNLINEVLNVLSEQLLTRSNNTTEIGLHQFAHQVDIAEYFALLGYVDDVEQAEDVLMHQVLHDYNLAQHALRINQILHMAQLLDGDLLTRFAIPRRNHTAIRPFTNQLYSLIFDWQLKHDTLEVGAGVAGDI